jgi:hypothetical protein
VAQSRRAAGNGGSSAFSLPEECTATVGDSSNNAVAIAVTRRIIPLEKTLGGGEMGQAAMWNCYGLGNSKMIGVGE